MLVAVSSSPVCLQIKVISKQLHPKKYQIDSFYFCKLIYFRQLKRRPATEFKKRIPLPKICSLLDHGLLLSPEAFHEAIILTVHLEDVAMMVEIIQ